LAFVAPNAPFLPFGIFNNRLKKRWYKCRTEATCVAIRDVDFCWLAIAGFRYPPRFAFRNHSYRQTTAMKYFISFLRREDGTTSVEYAVMLAMILGVLIAGVMAVGTQNGGLMGNNNDRIGAAMGS
jgi:Flp pilus assembly pilin Flp